MGAPTKNIRRNNIVKFRLTDAEKDALQSLVNDSIYQNVSEMVRDVTLNGKYKVVSVDTQLLNRNDLLLQQVRNVGNNFNQLIKLLHSKKLTYFTKDDVKNIRISLESIKDSYTNIESYFSNDR